MATVSASPPNPDTHLRNTWLFVVLTLLLVSAAWWQYQLVQNLSSPLPVPENNKTSGIIERTIAEPEPGSLGIPLWNLRLDGEQQTVQLDRALIESAQSGDLLSLTLPNGDVVDTKVTERIQRPSGNIHLDTRYVYEGHDYPLLITQSRNRTFATFSTPDGVYELSAKDGLGSLTRSIKAP